MKQKRLSNEGDRLTEFCHSRHLVFRHALDACYHEGDINIFFCLSEVNRSLDELYTSPKKILNFGKPYESVTQ